MKNPLIKIVLFIIVTCFPIICSSASDLTMEIEAPACVIGHSEKKIKILFSDYHKDISLDTFVQVYINGDIYHLNVKNNVAYVKIAIKKRTNFIISLADNPEVREEFVIRKLPSFLSLLPPLIAIILAILFKEVVSALFIGIFFGILFLTGIHDPINWVRSPMIFIDHYVLNVVSNQGKSSVIIFSLIIGGMVSLLMKNGSMHHLVFRLMSFINSRKKALFSTWLMGIVIFFDDYANTLIVGNSVRPLTDKFRISREKLAYIVDSTAAPVASVAFVTTWIGAQLNYIGDAVNNLGLSENTYMIFLNSLP